MKNLIQLLSLAMIVLFVGNTSYAQTAKMVDISEIQQTERSITNQLDEVEDFGQIAPEVVFENEPIKVNQGKLTPHTDVGDHEMVTKRLKRAEMEKELAPARKSESKVVKLGSGRKMNCERFIKKAEFRVNRSIDGLEKLKEKKSIKSKDYRKKMTQIGIVQKEIAAYKSMIGMK